MKLVIKNLFLLVAVLVLSYFTAPYFGALYDYFVPQYDGSFLGLPKSYAVFIAGVPFAYVFFTVFIFKLFGSLNKNKWIIGLTVPALIVYLMNGMMFIYLPIFLGLIAFGLAKLINLIILKLNFHKG